MIQQINALEIDYSLLNLEIDESKIENILAMLPEEVRSTLTFEEKMEYVKKILNYDVTEPIKNLFDDVFCFVSKTMLE